MSFPEKQRSLVTIALLAFGHQASGCEAIRGVPSQADRRAEIAIGKIDVTRLAGAAAHN